MNESLIEFYTREALEIHALCDRAGVPSEVDGARLSMAQRVAVMEGVLSNLIARTGMVRVTGTLQ